MPIPPLPDSAHPVLRFEDDLRCGLEGLAERVGFMSAAETAAALRAHHANRARLEALGLALIAHGERVGVAESAACTSMVAWLRTQLLMEPREARRQVRLARLLDQPEHEPTRVALVCGRVDVAAARVVLEAVAGLPRQVGPGLRAQAESHLLELAGAHDVGELRGLAAHLDRVLDPVGAERREAQALARAEAKAARETWCQLWFDEVTQTSGGRFQTDLVTGRKLGRMLEALMSPTRPDPIAWERVEHENGEDAGDGRRVRVSADERRGRALVELIDRVAKKDLPTTGGCDPVVVVTMSLETLTGGLAAAVLDTGEHLSPGVARRLAARHGVIPAVLGSRSEVLDLGRKVRLASRKQRLAMCIQQHGTCAVEGCDRPIAWADAHHLQPWRNGGKTNLRDLVMPCKQHHRMADHPDYRVIRLGPGRIRIIRRT